MYTTYNYVPLQLIMCIIMQILTEGQVLLQLKLDSLLWYSAFLHSMMPERSWSVDHDDYYAASTHLFGNLCEIFICSIKLLAMLSGLFISAQPYVYMNSLVWLYSRHWQLDKLVAIWLKAVLYSEAKSYLLNWCIHAILT